MAKVMPDWNPTGTSGCDPVSALVSNMMLEVGQGLLVSPHSTIVGHVRTWLEKEVIVENAW